MPSEDAEKLREAAKTMGRLASLVRFNAAPIIVDLFRIADDLDSTRAIAVGEREKELSQELKDMQATFDICWKADMRAIKRWQQETGKTLTWPDRADMVVWLLQKLDERGGL